MCATKYPTVRAAAAVLAVLPAAWTAAQTAEGAAEGGNEKVVRSASGYAAEIEPGTLREVGSLELLRMAPEARVRPAKGDARTMALDSPDHWIYDAYADWFFDSDGDGYYRYLRVTFDVDSYYYDSWVFAQLYLSANGSDWELFHETDDFYVDGAVPDDAYQVETELLSGYPPGLYDLLVEIYDADTLEYMDEFGPAQSSSFALLPLEDAEHDVPPPPVVVEHHHGGGGAVSAWSLGLLAFGAGTVGLRRRVRRANSRAPASRP